MSDFNIKMLCDIYFEPYNGLQKRLRRGEMYKVLKYAYHQLPDPRNVYGSIDGDKVGVWVEYPFTTKGFKDKKEIDIDWAVYVKVLFDQGELNVEH